MTMFIVRYFLAVGIHQSTIVTVLAGTVLAAIWTCVLDPSSIDSGLGMVLLVQMFLASTGFTPRARQGHFDALLAEAQRRTAVAIVHALVSALPGVIAWLALASAGAVLGSPAAASALTGSRAAALVIVSVVAWSAGFMLPRGAAGFAWIVALVGLLLSHVDLLRPAFAAGESIAGYVLQALTILVCPFLLIGTRPAVSSASIVAAVGMAIALGAWTIRVARRLDIYLADGV